MFNFQKLNAKKQNSFRIVIIRSLFLGIFFNLTVLGQINFLQRDNSFKIDENYIYLMTSATRTKIDLNGNWNYVFNGSVGKQVSIPSCYTTEDKVEFSREIDIPADFVKNKVIFLVCYGINYQCEVFVNNEFVGHHVGGYSSFNFKVPESILNVEGKDVIRIEVDNHLNAKETIPLQQQIWGWKNYGGIVRDIYLVAVPIAYIEDVYINSNLNVDFSSAMINIQYSINSTDLRKLRLDSSILNNSNKATFEIYSQIIDNTSKTLISQSENKSIEVESNRNIRFNIEMVVQHPNLWSPSLPSTYTLKSFISKNGKIIDEYDQVFGIRKIQIESGQIFLNGIPFTIKGLNKVEDFPKLGTALSYENLELEVLAIKNLGANVIYNRFFPPNPFLASLCDKYGIFLLEEIPVWNVPIDILISDKFFAIAEVYIREMIIRDRSHPCVLAWGIGSNFDSSDPKSIDYCHRMNQVIKSIDDRFSFYQTSMVLNDTCYTVMDLPIVEINEEDIKKFEILFQSWRQKSQSKPLLVSFRGSPVQPNNNNGYSDPQSDEHQAQNILNRYRALHKTGISGTFLSTFADWKGEKPLLIVNNSDQYTYTSGLLSYNREIRVSYNMLKTLYNDEKIPTLIVGAYNHTYPLIYIIWGLVLLVLFSFVFNSYRRFRENIVRSFLRPYNFYADIRDQRIFSNVQTSIMALIISGTFALITSDLFYFYRDKEIFDYILTHIITNNSVKAWFNSQIWNPAKFLLVFTLINLLFLLLLTLMIKFGSVIARRKIFLSDSYAIVIWSGLPSIFLIPLGMIISRIIENPGYYLFILGFIGIEVLWILHRLLKGVAIVYDINVKKVYLFVIMFFVIFGGSLILYYNIENSSLAYTKFVLNILQSTKL